MWETEDDDEHNDDDQNPMYRSVTGFRFPLKTPEMVEDLEKCVRADTTVRQQYVSLCRF